jgi:hypothetical protein
MKVATIPPGLQSDIGVCHSPCAHIERCANDWDKAIQSLTD